MQSVEGAIAARADLLVVHHGMYWRGAEPLTGNNLARLRAALAGDLAVYSSHIPLDLHPELGNNVLLARELRLEVDGAFGNYRGVEIGVTGRADFATAELFGRVRDYSARYRTTAVCTAMSP